MQTTAAAVIVLYVHQTQETAAQQLTQPTLSTHARAAHRLTITTHSNSSPQQQHARESTAQHD